MKNRPLHRETSTKFLLSKRLCLLPNVGELAGTLGSIEVFGGVGTFFQKGSDSPEALRRREPMRGCLSNQDSRSFLGPRARLWVIN